jgi:hypothetical protein
MKKNFKNWLYNPPEEPEYAHEGEGGMAPRITAKVRARGQAGEHPAFLYHTTIKYITCIKMVSDFPVLSQNVTNKLSLAGNYEVITGQGEFGQ